MSEDCSFKVPLTPLKDDQPKTYNTIWRVINLVMGTFFLLAALANLNDDDWYLWVPLYLMPFGLCLSASVRPSCTANRTWRFLVSGELVGCGAFLFYQISALAAVLAGTYQNPLVHEEGRETGGLLIILAWTGLSAFTNSESLPSNSTLMMSLVWVTAILAVVPLMIWSLCFVGDWHRKLGHCSNMFLD